MRNTLRVACVAVTALVLSACDSTAPTILSIAGRTFDVTSIDGRPTIGNVTGSVTSVLAWSVFYGGNGGILRGNIELKKLLRNKYSDIILCFILKERTYIFNNF